MQNVYKVTPLFFIAAKCVKSHPSFYYCCKMCKSYPPFLYYKKLWKLGGWWWRWLCIKGRMTLVYLRRDRTSLLPGLLSFDLPCFHIVCHAKDCAKFQYNLTPKKCILFVTAVTPLYEHAVEISSLNKNTVSFKWYRALWWLWWWSYKWGGDAKRGVADAGAMQSFTVIGLLNFTKWRPSARITYMGRKGPRAKTKTVLKSVTKMQQLDRGGWVISERAIFLHILISSWIGGTIRIQYHQSGQMASDVCLPWWVHIDIDIVIMINDNDEWTSGMAKWVNWCVTVFTLCGLTLGWHLMI